MIGDLSREDAGVLVKYGSEFPAALEFGCGGSTQILGEVCAQVVSLETSPAWKGRTEAVLYALGISRVIFELVDEKEDLFCQQLTRFFTHEQTGPISLMLNDGVDLLRLPFARVAWQYLQPNGVMLFHDTRREWDQKALMDFLQSVPPGELGEVIFNADRSNMTVVRKAIPGSAECRWDKTFKDLPYVDWNEGKEDWEIGEFGIPNWRKARQKLDEILRAGVSEAGDQRSEIRDQRSEDSSEGDSSEPRTKNQEQGTTPHAAETLKLRNTVLVHLCSELTSDLERESIRQVKEFCGEDIAYQIHYHPPTRVMPEAKPLFVQGMRTDLKPGHYGCWRAFQEAFRTPIAPGEFLIVCERDVMFEAPREEVLDLLRLVQEAMLAHRIAAFSFGDKLDLEKGNPQSPCIGLLNDFGYLTLKLIGLQFLVFSHQGVEFMREAMDREGWHGMDVWMNVILTKNDQRMGILTNRVTSQLDGQSIIDGMQKTFLKKPKAQPEETEVNNVIPMNGNE